MTPPGPEGTAAAAVLDAFLAWIEAVYGEDEATALRGLAGDKGAFLEPETWVTNLQTVAAELQARKPVTDERLEQALPLLLKAQQLLASPSEYDEGLLQTEPGSSFLAFLHDALDRLGAPAFIAT